MISSSDSETDSHSHTAVITKKINDILADLKSNKQSGKKRKKSETERDTQKERKYLPRELGHFYRVTVNKTDGTCMCNCEMYHFCGECCHTKLYSMIEFGLFPEDSIMQTNGVDWNSIRKYWIEEVLVSTVFSNKDGAEDMKAHMTCENYFPTNI